MGIRGSKSRVGCNIQLESEGTGEDGGQEDRILANDGPKMKENSTVRRKIEGLRPLSQVERWKTCW